MVYNAEYDAMMAYWNWADDQGGGVGAEVRLRISYDGVHWGVPVTYDEMTRVWSKPTSDAERQVADGEDDFITAIASPDRYDMLSPTIVYDDFRDVFILWANNTGDVGYQNGQANFVEMRYSDDGSPGMSQSASTASWGLTRMGSSWPPGIRMSSMFQI